MCITTSRVLLSMNMMSDDVYVVVGDLGTVTSLLVDF